MAKFEPWKRNTDVDPNYPWHSRKTETGEIAYSIPLECLNEIPTDGSDNEKKRIYSWLPLFGGKGLKVYWEETTSREWAYDQKKWIDAEAQRNERHRKHETLVEEVFGDGSSEKSPKKGWSLLDESPYDESAETVPDQLEPDNEADNILKDQKEISEESEYALDAAMEKAELIGVSDDQKDETPEAKEKRRKRICDYAPYRFPQTESHAISRLELESVTEYLKAEDPRRWMIFYMKEFCGISAEEIAEMFHVNPSRIYQLVDSLQKLGLRYWKENK